MHQQQKPLVLSPESCLLELLNEVENVNDLCIGCGEAPYHAARSYITNTSTRAKIIVLCSEHAVPALTVVFTFQDSTKQRDGRTIYDVTPEGQKNQTFNRIHSIPLIVDGKIIRLLLATDKEIDASEWPVIEQNAGRRMAGGSRAEANEIDSNNVGVVLDIRKIFTGSRAESPTMKLSQADKVSLLKSGLEGLDNARRELENAHAKLQVVLPDSSLKAVNDNIHIQAFKVRHSATEIARLTKDNDTRKPTPSVKKAALKHTSGSEQHETTDEMNN